MTCIHIQMKPMDMTSSNWPVSTSDLYPQVTCIQIQVVFMTVMSRNWPESTSDLYPNTSGAYECDITKLTSIHKWPVSRYRYMWCLWQWHQQTDLYPQLTCIQIQVGSHEQSRCIQTFNRGCFKMRGILKLLQMCSKHESKHLVISISDCICQQYASNVNEIECFWRGVRFFVIS